MLPQAEMLARILCLRLMGSLVGVYDVVFPCLYLSALEHN